nr:XRE transcriptional regulator [uncultured bacterium]
MTEESPTAERAPVDLETQVGARIAHLRTAHGWSQAQLGERLAEHGLPLPQPLVYRVEKGRRPLRVNEAQAFARTFGVDLTDLLGGPERADRESALLATIDAAQQCAEAVEAAQQAQQRYDEAQQALDRATRELREANRRRTDALVAFELASVRYNSLPPEKG